MTSPGNALGADGRKKLRAVLVGAGSLGRGLLKRLRDRPAPIDLVGVLTAHHGRMIAPEGIEPSLALNLVESDGLGESAPDDIKQVLEAVTPDVVIECIPQNIRTGEPALGILRAALDAGVHVVTANKAPIVLGYRDLLHRGAKSRVQFRFEATVLDGLPIFTAMTHLFDAQIVRIRAVLNATSSVVLETIQNGSTRSRGLARAQAQGIAEADSVLDLDGWDAASKSALLANVWMGGALRVVDVARKGSDEIKDTQLRAAAEEGLRYRLVAEIVKNDDGNIRASVEPTALAPGDSLYPLRGGRGGITIETSLGHTHTWLQETHGVDDAAFGLLQDCRAILAQLPQV